MSQWSTGSPTPDAAVLASVAPTGSLRVGINMANSLLVSGLGDNGEPIGVSPALADALAGILGVPLELVPFPGPGELVEALAANTFDLGNVGADPARQGQISFTAPYCEIEATFLVRADSAFLDVGDVDQPGVRISAKEAAAYTLWLDRSVAEAELIHTGTIEESRRLFASGEVDVMAGLRPGLLVDAESITGSRVLEGRFTAVTQAIGIHKSRPAVGLAYLDRFVAWATESGLVANLIERFEVVGLSIPGRG